MTAPSANATPPAAAFRALRQDVASRLCASSSEDTAHFRKRGQRLLRTAIVASMQHGFEPAYAATPDSSYRAISTGSNPCAVNWDTWAPAGTSNLADTFHETLQVPLRLQRSRRYRGMLTTARDIRSSGFVPQVAVVRLNM